MNTINCINLNFLFQSDLESSHTILRFLNKLDLHAFGQVNSQIKNRIQLFQRDQQNEEYIQWRQAKIQRFKTMKKQKKQVQPIKLIETDQNIIIKMHIFDIPLSYLQQTNWVQIDQNTQSFPQNIKLDQFIQENNNLFFQNKQSQDILFINRSLIDSSLNLQDTDFQDEESKFTKYKDFYQSTQFSSDNYDFSNMQSLLSRQKDLMSRLKRKEDLKRREEEDNSYLSSLQNAKKITIILCHGGYFSIGIFDGKGNCVFHKSDHKYVVRGKAGQRQLNCDSQSGKQVKSMGSQIRRDQEKKHQEKVHNILTESIDKINDTDIVFLQAPGMNKLLLIKENEPLMKVRHKIRSLCLTAKKANYTEVERIYKSITKIYIVLDKQ